MAAARAGIRPGRVGTCSRRHRRLRWVAVVPAGALLFVLSCVVSVADAHDASAWGGLFRSRDHGATWSLVTQAGFVGSALALAVSPTDPNHLLLGTDSGLLRSHNGGRDWNLEAPTELVGGVSAAAFDADGERVLVSTGVGVFRTDEGRSWRKTRAPVDAIPVRAIVRGSVPGRVYLAGWRGLSQSDDWGASWVRTKSGLPKGPATAVAVAAGSPETVYAVIGGTIWMRADEERKWVSAAFPAVEIEALDLNAHEPARIWAAGGRQLFRSDDRGQHWRAVGQPLPEPHTAVRGIAVDGSSIVVTTDRGLYRSTDDGGRWQLMVENLPAHLEAGPLVLDPNDRVTLYAGFSLKPYTELWQRDVAKSQNELGVGKVVGGAMFLTLVALAAASGLHRLALYYRSPQRRSTTSSSPPTDSSRETHA
jgi:photosystem II stability/assembly factor-like uncharacterized protein